MEAFHQALFPPETKVLGYRLGTLSLWHLAALQALRSPFLAHDADRTIRFGDLHLAVRVCAHPPGSALRLRPRWRDLAARLLHGRNAARFERAATIFIGWLLLHQHRPELWQAAGEAAAAQRAISAPHILSQVAALIALGIPHGEAWAMSPGYAAWLIAAAAERTCASVRFFTEEDQAFADKLAAAPVPAEDEVIQLARDNLPAAEFERWLAARQAAQASIIPPSS